MNESSTLILVSDSQSVSPWVAPRPPHSGVVSCVRSVFRFPPRPLGDRVASPVPHPGPSCRGGWYGVTLGGQPVNDRLGYTLLYCYSSVNISTDIKNLCYKNSQNFIDQENLIFKLVIVEEIGICLVKIKVKFCPNGNIRFCYTFYEVKAFMFI